MSVAAPPGLSADRDAAWVAYRGRVRRLQAEYAGIPAGDPVRLAKKTTNLFRARARAAGAGLDVASFDGVIGVDAGSRTAEVQGMTTFEHLVDATLAHGLMPLVVPELKTITLGGAVTGLGIESSSFRNGMPHESVVEMDILTGDGRLVTARRTGDHADLFYGFPNSYGTLGYLLRARIELEPVHPYVHLRHVPFAEFRALTETLGEVCASGSYAGEAVHFIDGTYEPLHRGGAALLDTVTTYLEQGHSLEATARMLFVHPNTVRYRLRRATVLTGFNPGDGRGGFALWLAVVYGRLAHKRT